MIFSNRKEFTWGVEVQFVLPKKDIKLKNNESIRSRVTCKVSNMIHICIKG